MRKGRSALCLIAVLSLSPLPGYTANNGWFDSGQKLLDAFLGQQENAAPSGLSQSDIARGLKEALRVGSEQVVGQLGQIDGFNADPKVHISLPAQLETVKSLLEPVGMAGVMTDLELQLNRAAEAATPQAKTLLLEAIGKLSFEDVQGIYRGPEDAATQYLRDNMQAPLAEAMRPLISERLAEVGAVKSYDMAMSQYESIPFVPDVKANLTDYALDKTLEGIFYYLAREEAAIRQDPVKRSTELLRQVFGG